MLSIASCRGSRGYGYHHSSCCFCQLRLQVAVGRQILLSSNTCWLSHTWLSARTISACQVSLVAADGWVAGPVSVGSPTAFNKAMGGWAAGVISVGSHTAFNVAMGGWAADTVVAEISASHCCHGSKTLAPIGVNQGKDGGCTCLCWVHWSCRRGFRR